MSTTDRFVPSAEAAFIAGVTQQQMNRLADEHLVPDSLLAREDGSRRFARITAAWARFFFQSDDWLVAAARKNILSELTARVVRSKSRDSLISLHSMAKDIDWIIADPTIGLQLDFTAIVSDAIARAKVVDAADERITRIDGVMGGKPCFKGTRLPIETVLSSLEKGIPEDRVLEEYSLTREHLEAARVHAQVHPQRGRPARLGSAKPTVQ